MKEPFQIKYLQNKDIDKEQWDNCISKCSHGLIYATSIYLDTMAPGWAALIADNYEWVIPLTRRKKFGINYLYQPAFTQQLGIFQSNESVTIPWEEIISFLKCKYKLLEINLNYNTPIEILDANFSCYCATNFILDLKDYHSLQESYHKDLKRNLKRSQQFRLVFQKEDNYESAIEEYRNTYSDRMKHVTADDYDRFKKICEQLVNEQKIVCRKAVNQKNELMAIVLLLNDGKRLYNLMNTTTPAGRKVEANHFLMDSVIREFAGKGLIFDFEGSELPGVKLFYKNFGAINQPFYMIKYNRLPWLIRLLKS